MSVVGKIRALFHAVLFVLLAALAGCGETTIDTSYGRVAGRSVNGTGAFADLLRARGHEVRVARRLTDDLADWADGIVRFLPDPGPPRVDEADWYYSWQIMANDRRLVLVCRDGDAELEYWEATLSSLPEDAPEEQRSRIQVNQSMAPGWGSVLPYQGEDSVDPDIWFAMEKDPGVTVTCAELGGSWAEGVDPKLAAIPLRNAPEPSYMTDELLLTGDDGRVLAMELSWFAGDSSAVLVIANGSFLLNAAIVPKPRRPLTTRVADWVGGPPKRIAFVEGQFLLDDDSPSMPTPWQVIRQVPELGIVAGHFMVLALLAALAHAVILGRPRSAPASGADRPRAHAEALGDLLARLGSQRASRSLLATYRRWRRPQSLDDQADPDRS